VISALGLDAALLAPLLPSAAAPAGHLAPGVAAELGLPAGILVAAGAAETAAAALGSGITGSDDVQLTVGTGAQVVRPVVAPLSRAGAAINLYRSATPRGWYQMGATINAGISLNWARTITGATWDELYAAADRPGPAGDPVFVPHLTGERTRAAIRRSAGPGPRCRWLTTGTPCCGPSWKESRSRSATPWMP
jgi:xylulokinase